MEILRRWWPALPALLIAWFGGESFLEKYPRRSEGPRRSASAQGPDSLLLVASRALEAERPAAGSARPHPDNFFRPIRAPRPLAEGRPGGMTVPPPPRNYHLKGTVGTHVATITNNAGQKVIVKIGDSIDSAVVVSIEASKVVLKDRAGRFELQLER